MDHSRKPTPEEILRMTFSPKTQKMLDEVSDRLAHEISDEEDDVILKRMLKKRGLI